MNGGAQLDRIDDTVWTAQWTPIFFREVAVIESNAYGVEDFDEGRMHGFDHYDRIHMAGPLPDE